MTCARGTEPLASPRTLSANKAASISGMVRLRSAKIRASIQSSTGGAGKFEIGGDQRRQVLRVPRGQRHLETLVQAPCVFGAADKAQQRQIGCPARRQLRVVDPGDNFRGVDLRSRDIHCGIWRPRYFAPGETRRQRIRVFQIRQDELHSLPPARIAQDVRRGRGQGPWRSGPVAGDVAGGDDLTKPIRIAQWNGPQACPLGRRLVSNQQRRLLRGGGVGIVGDGLRDLFANGRPALDDRDDSQRAACGVPPGEHRAIGRSSRTPSVIICRAAS